MPLTDLVRLYIALDQKERRKAFENTVNQQSLLVVVSGEKMDLAKREEFGVLEWQTLGENLLH